MTAHPTAAVAANLSDIEDLALRLLTHAVHRANDRLLPGGQAMIELAHVASHEGWANMLSAAERTGRPYAEPALEDPDDHWPALQHLTFWTEQWRAEWDKPNDRPTIGTEVAFIRQVLHWAHQYEPHFEEFADDIDNARTKLENLLRAGERAERGVPCMNAGCDRVPLVRKLEPYAEKGKDGQTVKGWRHSDWHCPRCHFKVDEARYWLNVRDEHEKTKKEICAGEVWCTIEYAAHEVGRPAATVRVWAHRREIATACMIRGRRRGFVRLAEVVERSEQAARRTGAA